MSEVTGAAADGSGSGLVETESVLAGLARETSRKDEYETDAEADLIVQRMAAQTVRRKANRHACTHAGPCPHKEQHLRDVADLQEMIQMLALPGKADPPTDEERGNILSMIRKTAMLVDRKPGDTMVAKTKR